MAEKKEILERYPIIKEILDRCEDALRKEVERIQGRVKNELKGKWNFSIEVNVFGEDETYVKLSDRNIKPISKMFDIFCNCLGIPILNFVNVFLDEYKYQLSIANAFEKITDVNLIDEKEFEIRIGEQWGNILSGESSYNLYYTSNLKIGTYPDEFFKNLNRIQNFLKGMEMEKDNRNFNKFFNDDLRESTPTYRGTLTYLSKRLAGSVSLGLEWLELENTLKSILDFMKQAYTSLTEKYGERALELFSKLVINGGFAEIYCFRKLVDAGLNVLPDIKINEQQVDAIIPIASYTIIICESTLSESLKDIQKVKDMLTSLGFKCKAVGITRGSFCQTSSFDRILTFQELNNVAKVISTILSLI